MKLEKFDLEKALNGAKVVTRDENEVTHLTKFPSVQLYSLVGLLDGVINTWTKEGIYDTDFAGECDLDLFLAVEPKRIWVNVYVTDDSVNTGGHYGTLEAAQKAFKKP